MSILNEFPTGDVQLGRVNIGATISPDSYSGNYFLAHNFPVSMDYSPNIKLIVYVADNPDYSNADMYETNYLTADADTKSVDHAFTELGTYYIKMQVQNENNIIDNEIEYSITVIRTLYFLEEPDVSVKSPQANKVTVIVKNSDPEIKADEIIDPAPNPDEIVERIIEIDEGDEAVCQSVANKMLDKLSGEQKNITGVVSLIVTLRFKEKVRIIYPESNIDEEMIIQSKEHDVTGRKTTISCGDIVLDDNELLSRILDDLS